MLGSKVIELIEKDENRYLEELKEFVRIPSISADPEKVDKMIDCANWVKGQLDNMGMENTEIIETEGHPSVYGEWCKAEGKPTILIYGHYDVQPVDPVDLWDSPPFEPTVKNGGLYGRGTVDDKGQILLHMKAVEAHLQAEGELPINIKFLVEGEEEVGSVNLVPLIKENLEKLKADLILISDSSMFAKGMPSICYGLRGISYFELRVKGTNGDLHSGSFGGAVINPANALARIIAKLKDEKGRILIPGIYDDVLPLTDEERRVFANLPHDDEKYRKMLGAPELFGEEGYSTLERVWARPCLDVNGFISGYTGEGAKTVIPAKASAKISLRLVPNQTPDRVEELFRKYIEEITPPSVEVEIETLHGGMPYISPIDNPIFDSVRDALKKGFKADTVAIREGGSIPIVTDFTELLKSPVILIGFGLPDENAHAPNEWIDLENYQKGILSMAYLYEGLAKN
ncbi:dipeptidase [Candidatus Marinimicrobia bacterium MT.SAG.3]|nr:dipeptidase [Candidatus Marinimicrobia bacterium MT.SAG.3]